METIDEIMHLARVNVGLLQELTEQYGVGRREARSEQTVSFRGPKDIWTYLAAEMSDLEQEQLRVVLINTRNVVIGSFLIYQGSTCAALIRIGEIFREAVRANAMGIVLAHNHPSGDATPSPEDVRMTSNVIDAGQLLSIEVLDHVVIGRDTFTSLRQLQGETFWARHHEVTPS